MIWGGGVGAKKLIGIESNEDTVIAEGYQRPRKIVQSRRGTGEQFIHRINSFIIIWFSVGRGFVFSFENCIGVLFSFSNLPDYLIAF